MKNINDLPALLIHHIENLYSAEEKQLTILPEVIDRTQHRSLKNALKHHLDLTKDHKKRLETIHELMTKKFPPKGSEASTLNKQLVCKGIVGLIDEMNELLQAQLAVEVTDAAIISCVQKIEHYEICTYGTAHAYAAQLNEHKIEKLLKETLDEEYDADDLLTALATAALNKEAIPEGLEKEASKSEPDDNMYTGSPAHKASTSERTINSPGGRAGTSHRTYPGGESRGH